jgi:hypothetical protein
MPDLLRNIKAARPWTVPSVPRVSVNHHLARNRPASPGTQQEARRPSGWSSTATPSLSCPAPPAAKSTVTRPTPPTLGRPGEPMPEVKLDVTELAELAELLQFLNGRLARDPSRLGPSLAQFARPPRPAAPRPGVVRLPARRQRRRTPLWPMTGKGSSALAARCLAEGKRSQPLLKASPQPVYRVPAQ